MNAIQLFGILREMMSPHWYGSAGKGGGGHYLMRFKIHCHRVAYLIVQKTLGEEMHIPLSPSSSFAYHNTLVSMVTVN